jgi:hypothetical protein
VERKQFTSNDPLLPDSNLPMFPENQALKINFSASYAFNNEYVTYPTGKFYLRSKYPRLSVNYTKGINGVFGSDVDYDLLTASLSKLDVKSGLLGSSSFWLGAGKFLNAKNLYFPDFKHVRGNRLFSYNSSINNFLFLDYYKFSTAQSYFEAHFQHNFSGFITNKIPYLRKLKLSEIVGFNYLKTTEKNNYTEGYLGIQYMNFRLIYGRAMNNGKAYDDGFRLALVL